MPKMISQIQDQETENSENTIDMTNVPRDVKSGKGVTNMNTLMMEGMSDSITQNGGG